MQGDEIKELKCHTIEEMKVVNAPWNKQRLNESTHHATNGDERIIQGNNDIWRLNESTRYATNISPENLNI